MKKKLLRKMTLFAIVSFSAFRANAQDSGKNLKERINDERGRPSFIVFNTKSIYKSSDSQKAFTEQLGLKANSKFTKIKSESDQLGFTHEKFQLYHEGLKVEYATYTLHSKSRKIASMSGEIYSLDKVNIKPVLTKEAAFTLALNQIGATEYLWESAANAKAMNYQKPSGELILFPVLENPNAKDNNLRLAYKFDIYATNPLSRGDLYIDAVTGAVLYYNATIKHLGAYSHGGNREAVKTAEKLNNTAALTATNAATRYSGAQSIQTSLNKDKVYILSDSTRGLGIHTYNLKKADNESFAVEFTDADNNWTAAEYANANKDNGALDAHWGAEKVYDYWKTKHDRNSYDNAGGVIKNYVHYKAAYGDSFWDGSLFAYGDGVENKSDMFTSIDGIGHEFGHAISDKTANLVYQKESGALNEGFSDIWGACTKHFAAPTKSTWLVCDDIEKREGHNSLRSMSDPKAEGQPDTYGGTYWIDTKTCITAGVKDHCGVHTNSSILSHWFYILSEGKSGTNDVGSTYSVKGITIEKAAKIAYRLERIYLTANATYALARIGGIQAALDIYGLGSAEVIATTKAFDAVNVLPDTQAPTVPTSFYGISNSNTTIDLSWNASTDNIGVSGYAIYNGTTLVTTTKELAYTVLGLTPNTAYIFTIKAKDGSGNFSATSTSNTATTKSEYCVSKGDNSYHYISRVQLGTIDKTSLADPYYSNFTAISTNLTRGSSATITVTPSSFYYPVGFAVWIDLNRDLDFDDVGELVWSKAASTPTFATGTFTIPTTAVSGSTRMRVSIKYNGIPTACGNSAATLTGDVEDYTVTLVGGIVDTQAPSVPTSMLAAATTATTTTLSWPPSTDNLAVSEYAIYNGTTLVGTVTGTNYTVLGLSANTNYSFTVKAKDAAGNFSAASTATFITTLSPYCVSKGNSTYAYIRRVQLGTINNPSSTGDGYSDYTAISTELVRGGSSVITVIPSWKWQANSNYEAYAVWIDFNGDQDFDDAGEMVWSKEASADASVTGTFTIPTTAISGPTRMRVTMQGGGVPTACNCYFGEVEDYTVTLIGGAADSQAPTVPENLVVSGTLPTIKNLSWTASADNVGVTGYSIYNGTTLVAFVKGLAHTASGLTANTAYTFTVKAMDAAGNLSAASNPVSTTNTPYCVSIGYSAFESISKVQIGSTITVSSKGSGYSDFTAISTHLTKGSSTTITITPSWPYYSYKEGYAVWIDFNGDSDFADAGELVWSKNASTTTPVTGTFTIPTTAVSGTTRMRVSMKYNGVPTGCEIFSYGEVEDYSVILDVGATDTQLPSAPENLVASGTTATTTTLSWADSTDNMDVIGYTIYNGTTFVATVSGTTYTVSGLTASKAYTFTVKARDVSGNFSVASNVASVTTTVPPVPYCSSKGTNVAYEFISNIQLGTINNASSGGSGYSDYTAISTNLTRGNLVTITVTPKKSSYDAEGYAVWIDYNGDGDFADTGELVWSIGASSTSAATGTIYIPNTASLGSTRMRVSMKYNGVPAACESFYYGEVEDYTVNIIGGGKIARITASSKEDLGAETIMNDFILYPNPVNDILNLLWPDDKPASFRIIDYLGQEVEAGMLSNNAVNVSKLAVGIYIVEVNDGQKRSTKKFIKN